MPSVRAETTPWAMRGRLRAVLFCMVVLTTLLQLGCSSRGSSYPLLASWQEILPALGTSDIASQAQALPYASLSVDIYNNQGLLVLGTVSNEFTYWQAQDNATLILVHGGLFSTGGLPEDVLSTQYQPVTEDAVSSLPEFVPWLETAPFRYRLKRSWQNTTGEIVHQKAEGQLQCGPESPVELPLQVRYLERCELAQTWANGQTTTDIIWRDPSTYQVWAARMTPWPGQRALMWQVARPWWATSKPMTSDTL